MLKRELMHQSLFLNLKEIMVHLFILKNIFTQSSTSEIPS